MSKLQAEKFLFLSGWLALDLVNTEVVVRGKRQDLLATPADLQQWWDLAQGQLYIKELEQVQAENEDKVNAALLEQIKELRTDLRLLLEAKLEGKLSLQYTNCISKLNEILGYGSHLLYRTVEGELVSRYQLQPGASPLLFQIGLSAFNLLARSELSRLHKCHNARCILFFYDTTKSATRQWCSFGCMNRARSSQHYRQSKVR